MSEGNNDNLKDLFKQAAEVAAIVPENMQGEAFNRAIEFLQGNIQMNRQGGGQVNPPPQSNAELRISPNQNWHHHLNRTEHPEVTNASTVLEKSLRVLLIARDSHGVDGLMPSDISKVLQEKFRLNVSAGQVSDKLGSAGAYVNRHKEGRGYVYTLMHPGELFLAGETTKTPTRRATPNARKKGKTSTIKTNSSQPQRKTYTQGPKPTIEKLIQEGFFKQPKVTNDVITHARSKMGYTYKATDIAPTLLRMVRAGVLTREKNEDGQYEYRAS